MTSVAAQKRTAWAWTAGTFFGVGFLRPGPGTWGSAAAALIWIAAAICLRLSRLELTWATLGATIAVFLLGVIASTRVEEEQGQPDPQSVVIDEVAGQWIALLYSRADLIHVLVAFLLFRVFDVLKPWPARRLENLPRGWGIMLDDVAAGVYALLVVQVLQNWIRG
jgi:phosphatidylglycerophosphatase A